MAEWRYGIFSCFEECRICTRAICYLFFWRLCLTCVMAGLISCFCFPCQIADMRATVLEEKQCGITDLILPCLCAVCCSIKTRSDLRRKYNIVCFIPENRLDGGGSYWGCLT
jgi:hypothetical protein